MPFIFFLLSDPLLAQGGEAPPAPSPWPSLLLLLVLFLIFYFLLIRPQQKTIREHQKLIRSLEKGDEVVTQGGIHGKIVGLTEQMVILEVDQGVKIRVDRASIGRRKGKEEKKEKEKEEKKEK